MELAIAAAVAMAGYKLSESGQREVVQARDYKTCVDPCDIRMPDDAVRNRQTSVNQKQLYDNDFRASQHPCQTGVIGTNYPFYRSEKALATSDAYKQDRFELFTGQLETCRSQTGTYQHKREQGPMFDPATRRQAVTSSGRQAYVDSRDSADETRYQVGMKHHGSGPVNSKIVGPGLGLDPDTPAAGGFHQFYRICPDNVGAYRKNNLPGRINPGKSLISGPSNTGLMTHKAHKPLWNLEERPLQGTRATTTAAACYGQQPTSIKSDATEGYAGHAFGGHLKPSAHIGGVRGHTDDRFCGQVLNAQSQTSQMGGYRNQNWSDPGAFKHALQALPIGTVSGAVQGGFQTCDIQVGPTQREQMGFQPQVNTHVKGQPIHNQHVRGTGRDTLTTEYMTSGVASSAVKGASYGFNPARPMDKPDTCVGYMPNGVTQNMWEPQVNMLRGRNPVNAAHVNMGGMASVNYGLPGSNNSCMAKLPIVADLDLNLAKDILNQNPLTHPIYA